MSDRASLFLRPLPGTFAACRFAASDPLPAWLDLSNPAAFVSVSRTAEELSVIARWEDVPPSVQRQGPFHGLVVQGPLPFDAVGILAGLAAALAAEGIPLLAVSTYDTDYLLVKAELWERAIVALRAAGHRVLGD